MGERLTLFSVAFITGILVVLSTGINQQNTDQRSDYDHYLMHQYRANTIEPDNPDMAAFQNYFMTIDPELKEVPSERLYDAYRQSQEMVHNNQLKSTTTDLEWIETGSNMGGRTRAVLWDPNDPSASMVWAAGVTGGLWFNNDIYDNSSEWQAVNDFWPSLSISCIEFDPNNTMTFYAGTGEYQTARNIYRESSGVGIGIWKSTDGGDTWDIIPSTEEFKYISDLKIRDENGTSIIYAGVVSGFYHGINHQSQPTDGLYRSANGGETWEQVLPNINGVNVPYAPADLDIGPEGRMFVGTMKNLNGDGGAAILYSDEGTTGTWDIFDDYEAIIQSDPEFYVPGRVIMATAPSDANRVYALIGAGWYNSSDFNYARGRYILKSNDGGESWSQTSLPGGDPDWASLSWHAFIAAVNPSNPDDIFVGGLDVWKSSNGGNSWSHLSDWALMYYGGGDDYVHADQHTQVYKPGSDNEMLLGSDGGVFYTNNASSGNPAFQEKNKNYSTLQFYACDIYPMPGVNYFVGGLQDNGTLVYMGEPLDINDMVSGGDGAYCFFDENEPNIMITSIYYNSYTLFNNWNYYGDMGNYGTGVFINPADYDSENNILYANGVNFNGSYSNRILRISGVPNNPNDQLVNVNTGINTYFSHVKLSPYSPAGTSTLFLGSQNGRLFKIENAQSNPVATEIGGNDFPIAYLSSLDIGGSEDTLLVTFSNYGVQSVWQTYDGGTSWVDISGNLPDMPIRWCLYHPQNSKQVMLATEVGIWATDDAGAEEVSWVPDGGMPNVRIDMLQMRDIDNTVLAATHGRGLIYAVWDYYNPSTFVNENNNHQLKVYPNPATDYLFFEHQSDSQLEILITSLDGKIVFDEQVKSNEKINIQNFAKGVYFASIKGAGIESGVKLVIQ